MVSFPYRSFQNPSELKHALMVSPLHTDAFRILVSSEMKIIIVTHELNSGPYHLPFNCLY